jgi:hypothetical protein
MLGTQKAKPPFGGFEGTPKKISTVFLLLGLVQLRAHDLLTGAGRDIKPLLFVAVFRGLPGAAVLTGAAIVFTGLHDAGTFLKAFFDGEGRIARNAGGEDQKARYGACYQNFRVFHHNDSGG